MHSARSGWASGLQAFHGVLKEAIAGVVQHVYLEGQAEQLDGIAWAVVYKSLLLDDQSWRSNDRGAQSCVYQNFVIVLGLGPLDGNKSEVVCTPGEAERLLNRPSASRSHMRASTHKHLRQLLVAPSRRSLESVPVPTFPRVHIGSGIQ